MKLLQNFNLNPIHSTQIFLVYSLNECYDEFSEVIFALGINSENLFYLTDKLIAKEFINEGGNAFRDSSMAKSLLAAEYDSMGPKNHAKLTHKHFIANGGCPEYFKDHIKSDSPPQFIIPSLRNTRPASPENRVSVDAFLSKIKAKTSQLSIEIIKQNGSNNQSTSSFGFYGSSSMSISQLFPDTRHMAKNKMVRKETIQEKITALKRKAP